MGVLDFQRPGRTVRLRRMGVAATAEVPGTVAFEAAKRLTCPRPRLPVSGAALCKVQSLPVRPSGRPRSIRLWDGRSFLGPGIMPRRLAPSSSAPAGLLCCGAMTLRRGDRLRTCGGSSEELAASRLPNARLAAIWNACRGRSRLPSSRTGRRRCAPVGGVQSIAGCFKAGRRLGGAARRVEAGQGDRSAAAAGRRDDRRDGHRDGVAAPQVGRPPPKRKRNKQDSVA